jgi:hypothetical protein
MRTRLTIAALIALSAPTAQAAKPAAPPSDSALHAYVIGRYAVLVPVLALAGGLVAKKIAPPSPGTFPTDGPLFVGLLASVVVIETALTFFPALALGPLLEQGLMLAGRTF